jgi:hypothetical protein
LRTNLKVAQPVRFDNAAVDCVRLA